MGEQKRKEQSKAEAFKESPERFIDMNDVIVAAVSQRNPDGNVSLKYFLNSCAPSNALKVACVDVVREINGLLDMRRATEEAERIKNEKPNIIT